MERFWSKVDKSGDCWTWTGKLRGGYGRFRLSGRHVSAHRLAYELLVGPIPDGLQLDHLCRNRACVKPAHLEAVEARVNILRGTGLAAVEVTRTHCPSGHPYDAANTIVIPSRPNSRYCRECNRIRGREYQRRRRLMLRERRQAAST